MLHDRLPQTRMYYTLRWGDFDVPPWVAGNAEEASIPRRRLILLMPGYNVPERKAQRELKDFELRLRALSASLSGDVGWLTWPGDWWVPLVRGAAYPFKVARTPAYGAVIGRFLQKLPPLAGQATDVVLVAHSLGCKIALEAADWLRVSHPMASLRVFLMGAAVAVEDVDAGGRLHDAARFPLERGVLHSTSDWVLRGPFLAGQAVAPGQAWRGGAVGTQGQPEGAWTFSEPMEGFGHGAYWTSPRSAEQFARFMGVPVPTAPPVRVARLRSIAPARDVRSRLIGVRRLGVR